MKKILCFGDSNTFGFNPSDGRRYDENTRWTGILAKLLSGRAEIIEAGANNRTMFANISDNTEKILENYLDNEKYNLIILTLGINDLQKVL